MERDVAVEKASKKIKIQAKVETILLSEQAIYLKETYPKFNNIIHV